MSHTKKVLVISYYWPPAGGIGVQRISKFCKYLPDFSWDPIILTVQSENYDTEDYSLVSDLQKINNVYRTKSFGPHAIYNKINQYLKSSNSKPVSTSQTWFHQLADIVRLNLFIPDSRIGWFYAGFREGVKIIEKHKPDLIFSTAPPYTPHLIALKLHKHSSIPWIADFRDPWVENTVYNTVKRLKPVIAINRYLEQKVLNAATKLTFTGPQLKNLYLKKSNGIHEKKAYVITNGFDIDDWPNAGNESTDRFYITYFGSLYKQRFHLKLFQSLSNLLKSHSELSDKLTFRVIGIVAPELLKAISDLIPANNLEILGYIPYKEAVKLLVPPQVFLLIVDDIEFNETITLGKIFDYLVTSNPIVGIGPLHGDTAAIIHKTNSGTVFDYNDDTGIYNAILKYFDKWESNNLTNENVDISEYNRLLLTKRLADIFNETSATKKT